MRLIDGDKLTHDLTDWQMELYSGKGFEREYDVVRKVINGISTTPTIDAVSVVRCKDCKYFSMTTLGMEYACWHGGEKVWGETGEHKEHTICTRIESPEHFCADGERREG